MLGFALTCFHNPYLPPQGSHVDAILTVSAHGEAVLRSAAASDGVPAVAEVLLVDVSGSMLGQKIVAARAAATVAVEGLRPGTRFAVLAGSNVVRQVYPVQGGLAIASTSTCPDAAVVLRSLWASGGTRIGVWLAEAARLLAPEDGIRHVTLLTDGQDAGPPGELAAAVESVRGVFQCDCRGVGSDWSVPQLRGIADALLGTCDIVADPRNLAADFAAITASLMGLGTASVALHVWTPAGVAVEHIKQVHPFVQDLAGVPDPRTARTVVYPTGAWGEESRDFHLRLIVPPGEVDDEILAARVTLRDGDDTVQKALVRGIWTDDVELSTRVQREVAHYVAQSELGVAIQEGLAARRRGDDAAAERRLGDAVALAYASGNVDALDGLERVVAVEDAPTGLVRLRSGVAAVDEMTLDTRSTKTTKGRA